MTRARRPHAGLGARKRQAKARKVVDLIAGRRPLAGARVLDVGCGAGHLTAAFARAVGRAEWVTGVDRHDQRHDGAAFPFVRVGGTALPFAAQSFDVVVSNHVQEHVGTREDQLDHLLEIRRVLKPDGLAFVAVPNRWRWLEPHYRLPLLSWLPQPLSSVYVRAARRGEWYDVVPPSLADERALLEETGCPWEDCTLEVIRLMLAREPVGVYTRLYMRSPRPVIRLLYPWVPSYFFLLQKEPAASLNPPPPNTPRRRSDT